MGNRRDKFRSRSSDRPAFDFFKREPVDYFWIWLAGVLTVAYGYVLREAWQMNDKDFGNEAENDDSRSNRDACGRESSDSVRTRSDCEVDGASRETT